jgi:hypothetical protein
MIRHDVEQGTEKWLRLRCGIPTASQFSRIITPGGKPSKSQDGYMYELLAERLMRHPMDQVMTWDMERGSALEAEAVRSYEFLTDTETEEIGFLTNDAGTIGASPDRLVGVDGLVEIKCPRPDTHVGYLLYASVADKYKCQLQGQLWIAERSTVEILSYHPEMPPALVHVDRDDKYIETLADAVCAFSERLETQWQKLAAETNRPLDWRAEDAVEPNPEREALWLSHKDIPAELRQ